MLQGCLDKRKRVSVFDGMRVESMIVNAGTQASVLFPNKEET